GRRRGGGAHHRADERLAGGVRRGELQPLLRAEQGRHAALAEPEVGGEAADAEAGEPLHRGDVGGVPGDGPPGAGAAQQAAGGRLRAAPGGGRSAVGFAHGPIMPCLARKHERSYVYSMTTSPPPRTEESDPFRLPPARAAELLAGAPWRRFAVIGDSLSAGTGHSRPGYTTLGWADRVADALRRARPAAAYLNPGRIGATTADPPAEQMRPVRAFEPDLLHLPSGANDLFRREPDFAAIGREMHRMFALAAETGAQLS